MIQLTVFYEGPFWVGFFEKIDEGEIEVCRVVFGSEPKDGEIYSFLSRRYRTLSFSSPISISGRPRKKINPKRLQREIKKSLDKTGVGTKAQEALKKDREKNKEARKKSAKLRNDEAKKESYLRRQAKKKLKKRGH